MSVLAVAAIAVGTTTTTTTVRSADTGGATGGGPSPAGSTRSAIAHRPSRPAPVTQRETVAVVPTRTGPSASATTWPVTLVESIRRLIDSPVPFIPPAVAPLTAPTIALTTTAVEPATLRAAPPAAHATAAVDRGPALPPPGGTAADSDAATLRARLATGTAVLPSGSAGSADADALRDRAGAGVEGVQPAVVARPDLGTRHAADARPVLPPHLAPRQDRLLSTTAAETAAAAIDSTDAAAAMQLAHALDAAGKGAPAGRWEDDPRSNSAVLRVDAAEAWSRHEQERAQLLADLRSAAAGLHSHLGADAARVGRLIGVD